MFHLLLLKLLMYIMILTIYSTRKGLSAVHFTDKIKFT